MHSQLCGFYTIQFVQDFVENLWLQQQAAPVACKPFVVLAEDCSRFSFLQGFGSCVQISRFLLVQLLRGKSILFGVCNSFFFPFSLVGFTELFFEFFRAVYKIQKRRSRRFQCFSPRVVVLFSCVCVCVFCFESLCFVGSGKGNF